ncbi:peroxiredoxin (alkyl hydroperoxide reductase subunit C) [Novosphingobium sp. PhB165]|uniref:peroxiredoxin n=1 Tax=Novosphingobium sp. PhB165 TaxID=2485105 RepID=UPI0010D64BAC|nr:redoxin domain-containing protein [Novosphingobium sp. PhB165]TCM18712.1 peroxiredoxin (alkyl hydroperoxide reductase subunit C) [Novosphingobium sp. PhB165]
MDQQDSALQPLRIGDRVPRFVARSTHGPFDLEDYRGHWLILFSHPADFTPVCTSEVLALARAAPQFAARDCRLVGLSIDSLYSHLAWIRLIRDTTGTAIGFPIIEDPTMEIARGFGMVGADAHDSATVRMTYFIDPDGVLQALTSYPLTVGRSVPEILRVLAALQRVRGGGGLAPADWQEGQDLLRAPEDTTEAVLASADPAAWFYTPLGKEG